MGKFEVLEYLQMLRSTGEDKYLRYREVHQALRRRGQPFSYVSIWRSMNSLYYDGLIEVSFDSDGLQRTAAFRARAMQSITSTTGAGDAPLQASSLKRLDNIPQNEVVTVRRDTQRGASLVLAGPPEGLE